MGALYLEHPSLGLKLGKKSNVKILNNPLKVIPKKSNLLKSNWKLVVKYLQYLFSVFIDPVILDFNGVLLGKDSSLSLIFLWISEILLFARYRY